MTKTATLAACLLFALTSAASARDLSAQEAAFCGEFARLIKLPTTQREALTTDKGTQGVRVRCANLTLVRLRFHSPAAAGAYARRAAKRKGKTPREVATRGAEVVLVGGSELERPQRRRQILAAAWRASLLPPSPAPKALRELVIKRAVGPAIRLRPLHAAAAKPTLPASRLAGTYHVSGSGQVVIDHVQPGPDGIRCRVLLAGFDYGRADDATFKAVFDGQFLVLTLAPATKGKPALEASFAWKPGAQGKPSFERMGAALGLPSSAQRFWHE